MKRDHMLAALLFSLATAAHGQTHEYTFTFAPVMETLAVTVGDPPTLGFVDIGLTSLSGRFIGEDLDSDGHIRRDELSWMSFRGFEYPGDPVYENEVREFDYSFNGGLRILLSGYRTFLETGNMYQYMDQHEMRRFMWRADTQITVLSAVPELPATAMLVCGMAMLRLRGRMKRPAAAALVMRSW